MRRYCWVLLFIVWGVGLLWSIRPPDGSDRQVRFVIPAGNARREAAGQAALMLPKRITLTLGQRDTLVVRNEDGFVTRIGGFKLDPGQQYTRRFGRVGSYELICSTLFHTDAITIEVVDRRNLLEQFIDRLPWLS
ncbi:MAG: hypothetical protein Fur005_07930 [Roseiflexaceae bacterium]